MSAIFYNFISDGNRKMQWTLENYQGKRNSYFLVVIKILEF